MALVDKLRKAREIQIEAGPFVFTARRPTDLEMVRLQEAHMEGLLSHVVGWAKKDGSPVSEIDLGLPGGEPHPLAFDADACREFLEDRVSLATVVVQKVVDAYNAHFRAVQDAAKN